MIQNSGVWCFPSGHVRQITLAATNEAHSDILRSILQVIWLGGTITAVPANGVMSSQVSLPPSPTHIQ